MSNISNDIINIAAGFVTYFALQKLDSVYFNNSFDKRISLSFFSIINYFIGNYVVATPIINRYHLNNTNIWEPIIIFITSIFLTVLYMLILKANNFFVPLIANKLNMNMVDQQSVFITSLSRKIPKESDLLIIVFDFENNFITSGFLRALDNNEGKQFVLHGEELYYTNDEAAEYYQEDTKNNELFIDYNSKIKIYSIAWKQSKNN